MLRRSPLPMLASAFATIAVAAALAAIPRAAAAQTPAASQPAADAPRNEPKRGHVDVAGAAIHYQLHGDLGSGKRPLLVLHGSFMSGDAMMPLIAPFTASRPVIAIDARGQGRSSGVESELSYERMADDAAAVLAELGVKKADVLGYSMGGTLAIALAVRHPDKTGKQVILSGTSRLDGWYPEVLTVIGKLTPEAFAGSPIESEYKRLSPSPKKFGAMIEKVKALAVQAARRRRRRCGDAGFPDRAAARSARDPARDVAHRHHGRSGDDRRDGDALPRRQGAAAAVLLIPPRR